MENLFKMEALEEMEIQTREMAVLVVAVDFITITLVVVVAEAIQVGLEVETIMSRHTPVVGVDLSTLELTN
jgi:predicted regulator of Ras-like GTPase activity (Roadblock/LC7/MglB family)